MAESGENFIQQIFNGLKNIPPARIISLVLTMGLVVGGFIALLYWTNQPDYQVLFTNLEPGDAARITEKLKELKTPYQLKGGGTAIMVPDDTVYQLRLDLASEGIPRGRNIGFEIFDKQSFGTTEFVQKLRYQQALQGELARTIMQFDVVDGARVHIVTVGDALFARPEKAATASVVLRLQSGRSLDQRQLAGIINLVASSIEGLKPENITVVDVAGGLLSKGHDADGVRTLSSGQFDYQRKLESTLEKRIQNLLEPVVGMKKVVASVSAEVDFRPVNISEEKYDPDSVVVRSEQRQNESSTDGTSISSGSPDMKFQVTESQGGNNSLSKNFRKENTTINYEINKVNRQIIGSVGDIKRLSAAVIIDGPYVSEKDSDGNPVAKFTPRSRKEMKNFEDIVKKAIGFTVARGDQVRVTNTPFTIQMAEIPPAGPEIDTNWVDYAKKGYKPLFNVLLIGLFFLFAVRPLRKWLSQAGEYSGQRELPPGDEVQRLESSTGGPDVTEENKKQLMEATRNNPDVAADIIKNWIGEAT